MSVPRWLENLRPAHEQRMFLLALGAGLPAVVVALVLLWTGAYRAAQCSGPSRW